MAINAALGTLRCFYEHLIVYCYCSRRREQVQFFALHSISMRSLDVRFHIEINCAFSNGFEQYVRSQRPQRHRDIFGSVAVGEIAIAGWLWCLTRPNDTDLVVYDLR